MWNQRFAIFYLDYSSLDRKLRNPSEFELRAYNIDGGL